MICDNIPVTPAYGVYTQCNMPWHYLDFPEKRLLLKSKLLTRRFIAVKLVSLNRRSLGRYIWWWNISIIRPVVRAMELTWFIRYFFYRNLQLYFTLLPKTFKLFGFPIFYDLSWWRLFQIRVVCTKLDIYVFNMRQAQPV